MKKGKNALDWSYVINDRTRPFMSKSCKKLLPIHSEQTSFRKKVNNS